MHLGFVLHLPPCFCPVMPWKLLALRVEVLILVSQCDHKAFTALNEALSADVAKQRSGLCAGLRGPAGPSAVEMVGCVFLHVEQNNSNVTQVLALCWKYLWLKRCQQRTDAVVNEGEFTFLDQLMLFGAWNRALNTWTYPQSCLLLNWEISELKWCQFSISVLSLLECKSLLSWVALGLLQGPGQGSF